MKIVYLQLALFIAYTSFVWKRYGVQPSISESWYTLGTKYNWMFTIVFCFGIGVLQLFHESVWFFLSGSALCFVGAATAFKQKMTNAVHYSGAAGAIVFGLTGLAGLGIWWPIVPVAVSIPVLTKVRNATWWIEFVAFFAILGGLIQKYL